MQGFIAVDLIILIIYPAIVLFAGLLLSKKKMKGKEFFRGDGTIPWRVTSVSIFAILLSPISPLSLTGNLYAGTWIMWFAQLGMPVAIPTTVRFFPSIYSKPDIGTAYHYLEIRFRSKGLRVLGAVMFIVYQVGHMSIIMYLPSMVSSNLTGINVNVLIITMDVIVIIYSYTGGLKSVLWISFIQGSVLLVDATFAFFYLAHGTDDGFGSIFPTIGQGKSLAPGQPIFNPNTLRDNVFLLIVSARFSTYLPYVSSQGIVQRLITVTDTRKLNKMMLTNRALPIFIATVLYLIDTGLYVFHSQNAPPSTVQQDQIFASYIAYELPVGITGLLLTAIYAVSQSTLSTGFNSAATSWILDTQEHLSKREISFALQTRIAQYVSLGVGVTAILVPMTLASGEIKPAYEWFNRFMGLVLGVLERTFVLGILTKAANAKGAYVTFFVAAITMICIKYMAPIGTVSTWSYSIISIVISLVVGLPVSIITREMDEDTLKSMVDAIIYHNRSDTQSGKDRTGG